MPNAPVEAASNENPIHAVNRVEPQDAAVLITASRGRVASRLRGGLAVLGALALPIIGCAVDAENSDVATATDVATSSEELKLPAGTIVNSNISFCRAVYTYPVFSQKFNEDWFETRPAIINNRGQVFGTFRPAFGAKQTGFERRPDGVLLTTLSASGTNDLFVKGANDLGEFVGHAGAASSSATGFFNRAGSQKQVGAIPLDINNHGEVVGFINNGPDETEGFLRSADHVMTNLGEFIPIAINDSGRIAGYSPEREGGIFDPGAVFISGVRNPDGSFMPIGLIKGQFKAHPTALNDAGQVAGYFEEDGRRHGFISFPALGLTVVVDVPNAVQTHIHAINNLGHVAGWAQDLSGIRHNFVRSASGQFITFQPPGPPGTHGMEGMSINDFGNEVATTNEGGFTKAVLSGPYFAEGFSSFNLTKTDIALQTAGVAVWGNFSGCHDRALRPETEPVVLKVSSQDSWATLVIPPGSFKFLPNQGRFEFHGVLQGVTVDAFIWELPNNVFDFRIFASGIAGLPTTASVNVFLALGDDIGSRSATATFLR